MRSHLERAAAGDGSLILLSGEPGIGKTRTCEQLADDAQRLGMQVFWGRCWEAGGAPAYWPWVQILRGVLMSVPHRLMAQWPSGHSATIARLLPETERPGEGEKLPVDDSPNARFQLFQGVAAIVRWAAQSTPLLILIDDLQGADESSLLLLELIARELSGTPVMIVGTYRELALATGSPLAMRLPELTRAPAVRRISLRPLNVTEVEAFVTRVVADRVAPGAIATLHQLTDGNPLFLIECLRASSLDQNLDDLARGRTPLPGGIRDAVRRHLAPLSAECRAVLRAAAVFGRDFGIVMLRDLLRYADDVLLTGFLDEAVHTDILAADGASRGRYRFVHALVREVLYAEMSNVEQLRYHHDAAMLLSSRFADVGLSQIAHHFTEAARRGADPEPAVRWTRRAGDHAMRSLAYEEAERLYGEGLDVLENFGPDDLELQTKLLLACGNVCNRLGEIDRAKKRFERAGELARALGSRELVAEAALGYGGPLAFPDGGYVDEVHVAMLEHAVANWNGDAHPLHAQLLTRLAGALYFTDQVDRRRDLCTRALEMARNAGDADALARVLLATHAALWGPNPEERLQIANELVRLIRRTGNRVLAFSAHHWRYCDLLELGDVGGMENEFHACRALAAELREPAMRGWIDVFRAGRAMWEGRFEECERVATENLGLAQWLGNAAQTLHFLQMFHLRALQGRFDEMLEPMRTIAGLNPGIPAFSVGLAYIHAEADRLEEARPLAAGIVAHLDRYPPEVNFISTLTCLGLVCARLGDAALTAPVYELMRPYGNLSIMIGNGLGYCGAAAHWLGVMATSLGRFDDATAHFERALAMETTMGSPPWIANTQYEYAVMLLARGDSVDQPHGASLLAAAASTAEALRMARLGERVQTLQAMQNPAPAPPVAEDPSRSNGATHEDAASIFRREGDFWTIEHGGRTLRLRNSRGLRYLARLVQHPRREFLVLDLAIDGGDNGCLPLGRASAGAGNGHRREPVVDRRARRSRARAALHHADAAIVASAASQLWSRCCLRCQSADLVPFESHLASSCTCGKYPVLSRGVRATPHAPPPGHFPQCAPAGPATGREVHFARVDEARLSPEPRRSWRASSLCGAPGATVGNLGSGSGFDSHRLHRRGPEGPGVAQRNPGPSGLQAEAVPLSPVGIERTQAETRAGQPLAGPSRGLLHASPARARARR